MKQLCIWLINKLTSLSKTNSKLSDKGAVYSKSVVPSRDQGISQNETANIDNVYFNQPTEIVDEYETVGGDWLDFDLPKGPLPTNNHDQKPNNQLLTKQLSEEIQTISLNSPLPPTPLFDYDQYFTPSLVSPVNHSSQDLTTKVSGQKQMKLSSEKK